MSHRAGTTRRTERQSRERTARELLTLRIPSSSIVMYYVPPARMFYITECDQHKCILLLYVYLLKVISSNMFQECLCVLSIAINGIIYNLKGLRMYTNQLVCWHLINMGSPKDFHSVHFHGQTFLHKKTTSYRQAVYPLLPGEQSDVCEIRITSFAALCS